MRAMSVAVMSVLLWVTGATAQAAVIHQPAVGASVQQNASLFFDWAWDADEYATTGIVFTQSGDPNDPVWTWQAGQPATEPGRRIVLTDAGYSFLESHATITVRASVFAPGQWYWRLCNKSIYGEDDKCGLDAEVRALTVTPAPVGAPPAPVGTPPAPIESCSDGIDCDQVRPSPPVTGPLPSWRSPTPSTSSGKR